MIYFTILNNYTFPVLGLIHLTQIFVRQFKQRNAGMIINLGSIAGREPYAGGSIYCATKHALAAFTGSLLRELVNTPIRVCEVQPGMVETEFSIVRFRGDKDAADAVYKGIQPCACYIPKMEKKLTSWSVAAQDIAEEIVWCASRPAHVNIAQLCKTTDPQGDVYQTDFLFSRHARQPSHAYSCSPKFLKS